MGWFSKLLGSIAAPVEHAPEEKAQPKPKQAPRFLFGDGEFSQEIVGESFYQKALDAICGGKNEDGHFIECEATLTPEPNNRYDTNAVAVVIRRSIVGHLDRATAVKFHKHMNALGASGASAKCKAAIVGGWLRSVPADENPEGHYGVKLDLVWPLRFS